MDDVATTTSRSPVGNEPTRQICQAVWETGRGHHVSVAIWMKKLGGFSSVSKVSGPQVRILLHPIYARVWLRPAQKPREQSAVLVGEFDPLLSLHCSTDRQIQEHQEQQENYQKNDQQHNLYYQEHLEWLV